MDRHLAFSLVSTSPEGRTRLLPRLRRPLPKPHAFPPLIETQAVVRGDISISRFYLIEIGIDAIIFWLETSPIFITFIAYFF
jgi:hypothetical protein